MRDSGLAAVFDGRRFVFNESAWTAVNVFNMLRRYGLCYFQLRAAPRAMLQHYLRLYDLQVRGGRRSTVWRRGMVRWRPHAASLV